MVFLVLLAVVLVAVGARRALPGWIEADRTRPRRARVVAGAAWMLLSGVLAMGGLALALRFGVAAERLTPLGFLLAGLGALGFVAGQARGAASLLAATAPESDGPAERPQ